MYLSRGNHVRLNIEVLVAPQLSGPADTRLDLIDDHQCTSIVAESAHLFKELGVSRLNASFALQRFHHDRS